LKIVYRSRANHTPGAQQIVEPLVQLSWRKWDDYGHKTTVLASLVLPSGIRALDPIKVLVEGQDFTANYFEKLLQEGWDGVFPPPRTNYISNPTNISFYEELESVVGRDAMLSAAEMLRDAALLVRVRDDSEAVRMIAMPPFNYSLLRERGDQRAYNEGWKIFSGETPTVEDSCFTFVDREGKHQNILFGFRSSSLLPKDINLLIGPNGVGKSQLLHQLVEHWLQVPCFPGVGFEKQPSFGSLIAISYSPFERLRFDTEGLELADRAVYQYFGLRGRGANRPTLSLDHARQAAVESLISCARDDRRFSGIKAWSQKLWTLHEVLGQAISFDFAAVEVPATATAGAFMLSQESSILPLVEVRTVGADGKEIIRRFVRIDSDTLNNIDLDAIKKHARIASGVTLFRNGLIMEMSSGQRLFSYLVINLLGSVRRNSLIIIDEPELFLHPTLETALITMLKSILDIYDSKAIIATHSLVLVREVPRDCVHVFEQTADGLLIKRPPFQTFGGDMQRISTYVFGDNSVTKPFEQWINEAAKAAGGRKQLLAQLPPSDLNEELLIELGDEVGHDDPAE
jgi:predicted ATPase